MMKIKLIDGTTADIPMESPAVRAHFDDPKNYTKEILEQFDNSIYKDLITKDDKVILDIGANIGLFALHVSPYAERIICVEPTPSHMAKQKEILKDLPAISYYFEQDKEPFTTEKPKITHVEAALSDKVGEQDFHWCGINTTMNSLQDRHSGTKFKVKTVDLFYLMGNIDRVNFCKIDIEGSEWQAITEETLYPVADDIDKIFIELHPPTGESQDAMTQILASVGYKVEKIIHDTLFAYR